MIASAFLLAVAFTTVTAFAGGAAVRDGDRQPPEPLAPPGILLGEFVDDYGDAHSISAREWFQRPNNRFQVVRWNVSGQYLIARTTSTDPAAAPRWLRIDWTTLRGMPPYEWAFCFSAYDAPSHTAAESTIVARRETPRTGCNGYPFTRMKRATPH